MPNHKGQVSYRVHYRTQGGHVHAYFWSSEFGPDWTHGQNGLLVFQAGDDWDQARSRLAFAGFVLIDDDRRGLTAPDQPVVPLATSFIYSEIQAERERQDQKWGQQDHPDGTGPDVRWMVDSNRRVWYESKPNAQTLAKFLRHQCQARAAHGDLTWLDIDLEEIGESYAEDDPTKLRAELVQRAAVLVAWIEAIDRRSHA